MTTNRDNLTAVILAAGKGTRMKSDLPKVVHEVGGRPMVCAVVDACLAAGVSRVIAVVGYKKDTVVRALAEYGDKVAYADQDEQLGTGHAVLCAKDALSTELSDPGADTFVLCGDGPLIRTETLTEMLDRHASAGAAATLATSVINDPTGYGRIVRDENGVFQAIVEQKNLAPGQESISEINPSYYVFKTGKLFDQLGKVEKNPITGEYYVTDVPAMLSGAGDTVEVVAAVPPEDVLSINNPEQLAEVDRVFRARQGVGA
ncbi:MAG: NTP transferase domain-containing protein [Planctomycetota bacterium]